MARITQEEDMTAHLVDVEPVALLGCTMIELKYITFSALGFWVLLFALIALPFGVIAMLAVVPLGLLIGGISVWFLSKRIAHMKVGKPHHYYIHKVQRGLLAGTLFSPWPTHIGRYRLGRSEIGQ